MTDKNIMAIYYCELCSNEYCEQTMNTRNGNHRIDCDCDDIQNCQAKCMRYCCPKCNYCSVYCMNDKESIKNEIVSLQCRIKELRKLLKK